MSRLLSDENILIRSNTLTHDNAPTYHLEDLPCSPNISSALYTKRPRTTPLHRFLQYGEGELQTSQSSTFIDNLNRWKVNDAPGQVMGGIFILLHCMLFGLTFINYYFTEELVTARATFGITYVLSRSAAQVLHMDIALILFPVCRTLFSVLRQSPLHGIIPFDKGITFHKFMATSIVIFTWVHVIGHWNNFARLAAKERLGVTGFLEMNFLSGPGWSGYIMLIVLMTVCLTSLEKPRRQNYTRFLAVHHLYVVFFGLWSIHGAFCMVKKDTIPASCSTNATFWEYWTFGGFLYLLERLLREFRSIRQRTIIKVILHPSNVVEIQFEKHKDRPGAGQYIFISCPAVSAWEYHPFTLTSAPEEDYLSIHVRMAGDFTRQLGHALGCSDSNRESRAAPGRESQSIVIDSHHRQSKLKLYIDGPFGTASEDVFKFETVLLVGAGIGVTPFASVLKSIWYRMSHSTTRSTGRVQKVYFFWICRDFGSLEWFQSLLSAIEQEDRQGAIELHLVSDDEILHVVFGSFG